MCHSYNYTELHHRKSSFCVQLPEIIFFSSELLLLYIVSKSRKDSEKGKKHRRMGEDG